MIEVKIEGLDKFSSGIDKQNQELKHAHGNMIEMPKEASQDQAAQLWLDKLVSSSFE